MMRPADEMLIEMLAPANQELRSLTDQYQEVSRQIRYLEGRTMDPSIESEHGRLTALIVQLDRQEEPCYLNI